MQVGHFYFLSNKYFLDFPDAKLMRNKEAVDGHPHDRPFFCAAANASHEVYWLIPISSKTTKYHEIYEHQRAKHKRCDTIAFADVLGHQKAFLIQNMCPATDTYVTNEYMDGDKGVSIRGDDEKVILSKAKNVLQLLRKGKSLIFPDVLTIEGALKSVISHKGP